MKVLIFIIIVTLLFISHCADNKYYINNDKGVVVNIKKVKNDDEVTIRMIRHTDKTNLTDVETYVTFLTRAQYNISDTIYFTKLK